ncbi:carbohydrate-binding protein [Streptomyces sp. NPDC006458]|uniref:carbohydrate-binding protein n=1 Tax=Streptomyces sp. NPDC006458 TaxID=3154302 RepID=UPI0033B27801
MDETGTNPSSGTSRRHVIAAGASAMAVLSLGQPGRAFAVTAPAVPGITGAPAEAPEYGDVMGESLSLAGRWDFKQGAYAAGDASRQLGDSVILPGTMNSNKKGTPAPAESATLDRLTSLYGYVGPALYQRTFTVPSSWAGRRITLLLERTKATRVWINGVEQSSCNTANSYGVAHEYYLSGVEADKEYVLSVEVDNTLRRFMASSHMHTEETQTNWNGILGKIRLVAATDLSVRDVRVYPSVSARSARVEVVVANMTDEPASFPQIKITAKSYNAEPDTTHRAPTFHGPGGTVPARSQETFRYELPMGDRVLLWSEWEPNLYRLTVKAGASTYRTSFGMRDFATGGPQNQHFTINGKITYLRGEANSAVFPLSGHPYMSKEDWRQFLSTAQELGINFFRFHSWMPPEAAFAAADELGVYMQPELYNFGGSLADYYDACREEAELIAAYLANHPSYVAMTWGNEVNSGPGAKRDASNRLRTRMREVDPTRLYAEGTNANYWAVSLNAGDDYWVSFATEKDDIRLSFSQLDRTDGGEGEAQQPNSSYTFARGTAGYRLPIMSHEVGQYQVYPVFEEEVRNYRDTFVDEAGVEREGVFDARNLKKYQQFAEAAGLGGMTHKFALASARVSALGYKADMETSLRTPGLAGYQLLSIQDFPGQKTALVGILDCFMKERSGGLPNAVYKGFNNDVSLMARMDTYLYGNTETLKPVITIANYGPRTLPRVRIEWTLGPETESIDGSGVTTQKGPVYASGSFTVHRLGQGTVTDVRTLSIALAGITRATKMVLRLASTEGFTGENFYNIWVYPGQAPATPSSAVLVTRAFDQEAKDRLAGGGRVLLVPDPEHMPRSVRVQWRTDYWSKFFHTRQPSYDRPQRSGKDGTGVPYAEEAYTMGMYVEDAHPVFADFPTEFFSDYQWYNLMKGSRALVVDELPHDLPLIAQNIDHIDRHHRLGSMFEARVGAGSLFVCSFDILDHGKSPEVKQLFNSVVRYVESAEFDPQYRELTAAHLSHLFEWPVRNPYTRVEAESYDTGNKAFTIESGKTSDGANATAIGGISGGEFATYKRLAFSSGVTRIEVNGANGNSQSATIEIRKGGSDGELMGTVAFANTGTSWKTYSSQTFSMATLSGTADITLVFKTGGIALNYVRFIS